MTIKELIDRLEKFPPNMKVVTRGYEDGYESPVLVEQTEVHLDVYSPHHYNGNHQEHEGKECYCHGRTEKIEIEEVVSITEY